MPVHRLGRELALVAAALFTLTPGFSQGQDSPVTVGISKNGRYADGARALPELKAYLERSAAALLAPGQRLAVVIDSLDRAGVESWRGASYGTRVRSDTMPARMELQFTLTDAAGDRVAEGRRSLRSPAFFSSDRGSDPLRHEKALLDGWLREEFRSRPTS